jgi:hypothetical protein
VSRIPDKVISATPKFSEKETLEILEYYQKKHNIKVMNMQKVIAFVLEDWSENIFGVYGLNGKLFDINILERIFLKMKVNVEFDALNNKVVVRKEELRNGQIRVKEFNSDKEYEIWDMWLRPISRAIQLLEVKKREIDGLIEELECLI